MNKAKVGIYILLIFSVSIWGMSFVWTSQLLTFGFRPISVVFFRLILAALFMLLVSASMGKLQRPQKKDLKYFFLMALFEPFLYFIGETFGIQRTSPTVASVIVSTIPLFSPIVAFYLYRERLALGNFLGVVISIIGVCLVIFYKGSDTGLSVEGLLLLVLAIAAAIFYSAVVKKLTDSYNPYTIVVFQNAMGVFYFLPLFLLIDSRDFMSIPFCWSDIMPLIMLAIFASGIAFIGFVDAIGKIGMTRTNMFVTLIPALTAVFSFFIGLESLTTLKILGIILVIVGLVLSQQKSFSFKLGR